MQAGVNAGETARPASIYSTAQAFRNVPRSFSLNVARMSRAASKKRARAKDFSGDWITGDDGDWSDEAKPVARKSGASKAQQAVYGRLDFKKLDTSALLKYRALFRLPGDTDDSKTELIATVSAHFYRQQVDEDETLLRFVVALRRQSPKGLHIGPAAKKRVSQSKPERAPPS